MDLQQIITLLIVALAAVFLARRLLGQAKGGEDACGGCGGGCGKPVKAGVRSAPEAKPLITLGTAADRPRFTGPAKTGSPQG